MDRLQRPVLVVLTIVVTLLPACYDWHVPQVAPSRYIVEQRPGIVRVTLTDGSGMDIEDPSMVGESIVGILGTSGRGRQMVDSTVSVPVADVTQVEVRELNGVRTAVGVGVVVGALALTVSRVFSNWVHR